MASLNIFKEQLNEYTLISNYFIDHYMEDANEAQLQVYFYLLRMVSANLPVSVADIAEKFKHSEKEVLRALKYWELQNLLSLDFDAQKNLTGIHFLAVPKESTCEESLSNQTQAAPSEALPPAASEAAVAPTPAEPEPIRDAEPTAEQSIYIKPSYTADQLRAFKSQENAAQLLFVAQEYVGKPLTPGDIKTIYFMWDVLHFSDDLIDYLIQYCVDRGKRDFRYMEKVAINWAEEGITTPKQAQKAAARYDKNIYSIMNALGKNNSPTTKEVEYIQRWINEYGFTNDIILEACSRTVLATDKHRFDYAEGILSNWRKQNVHHKSDIEQIDRLHQKKNTGNKPGTYNTTNRFNQFTQNTYEYDELEKQLLSN